MGVENINYKEPEQYIKNLNELGGSIDLLLAEFSKIYVVYNMNSNNPEYQQQYANIISNINQVQSKLFSTSNDVQVSIDEITKKLVEINVLISNEREKNRELKRKLGHVEHKNNSAYEMIDNYKQMYNINYLRNWGLFLSTVLCILAISKVYKSQGV
jgi:DNA repair exonuclease SbcCD ATPase subunit